MSVRMLTVRCGRALPLAVLSAILLVRATANPIQVLAATSCDSLASLALPNTTITSAEAVPAGGFTQPGARGAAAGATRRARCPRSAASRPR